MYMCACVCVRACVPLFLMWTYVRENNTLGRGQASDATVCEMARMSAKQSVIAKFDND